MLNKQQIEHLAKLAKLDVTEEEKDKYAQQISSVLDYFNQIKDLDVEQVTELEHLTGLSNVTRFDEERIVSSTEVILDQAPETKDRQIKVSAVFNRE